MKYLKEYKTYEEASLGRIELSHDQIEALPAYKRLAAFVKNIRSVQPTLGSGYNDLAWEDTGTISAKGIRILGVAYSPYTFRFNPRNQSLKYGQETINKGFELKYETLEDWNRAVEEADKFHLAVFLGIKMPTLRSFADPKKLKKWILGEIENVISDARMTFGIQRGQTVEGNIEKIKKKLSVIVSHIMDLYKMDKNDTGLTDFDKIAVDYFSKETKGNPGKIGDIPEMYRADVLAKLGYSDDDANAILDLHDLGIF